MCGSGQRAAVAASLVRRYGAETVIHVVDGGVPKWGRLGHRLERSSRIGHASA
jgi:rhodanese-related sulfurtransferase